MLKYPGFVSITVSDQERALAFYRDKLGMRVRRDSPMSDSGGGRWLELALPGAQTGLVLMPAEAGLGPPPGYFLPTAIACTELDATCAELEAKGVPFQERPTRQHWGRYALIRDPDGNILCLAEPDAASDETRS